MYPSTSPFPPCPPYMIHHPPPLRAHGLGVQPFAHPASPACCPLLNPNPVPLIRRQRLMPASSPSTATRPVHRQRSRTRPTPGPGRPWSLFSSVCPCIYSDGLSTDTTMAVLDNIPSTRPSMLPACLPPRCLQQRVLNIPRRSMPCSEPGGGALQNAAPYPAPSEPDCCPPLPGHARIHSPMPVTGRTASETVEAHDPGPRAHNSKHRHALAHSLRAKYSYGTS